MPAQFRTHTINIASGTGRRTINSSENFNATVQRAGVALNGFKLDYENPEGDRSLNVLEVDTDVINIAGNTVFFRVECQLADKNFDDPYSGYVTVLVIAELP